jgi:asparagine synthase (glutamine-hydrolysing)
MSWGLEARVPFLDKGFLELMMPLNPKLKLKDIEKYILRKSFDTTDKYLPNDILWRQKEQFSDGVGYNWIDGLKEYINNNISDEEFKENSSNFKSKEELYYRRIFDRLFPDCENIVPRWIPKMDWDGVSYDPSGRAQKVHIETIK